MYELPALDNVIKVVIDDKVVHGEAEPLLIYSSQEGATKAVSGAD
jgi:ATP-dependent Clp protease ATP-binding subunit ClpX